MKEQLKPDLAFSLKICRVILPPGVPLAEVRATANVLYGAGWIAAVWWTNATAANNVLQIDDGAIVDVGGGTTASPSCEKAKSSTRLTNPPAATHFSLVIAGAKDITFEQAEALKIDPKEQLSLFPTIRPVMEKVAISLTACFRAQSQKIYLVGGTCAYPAWIRSYKNILASKRFIPEAAVCHSAGNCDA